MIVFETDNPFVSSGTYKRPVGSRILVISPEGGGTRGEGKGDRAGSPRPLCFAWRLMVIPGAGIIQSKVMVIVMCTSATEAI